MSNIEDNPFLKATNYYSGYQEGVDKLKETPEIFEMDKLIYEVFHLDAKGARLLELFERDFVMPSLAAVGAEHYERHVTYYEGFKDAFRRIRTSVEYQKRIAQGGVSNE